MRLCTGTFHSSSRSALSPSSLDSLRRLDIASAMETSEVASIEGGCGTSGLAFDEELALLGASGTGSSLGLGLTRSSASAATASGLGLGGSASGGLVILPLIFKGASKLDAGGSSNRQQT